MKRLLTVLFLISVLFLALSTASAGTRTKPTPPPPTSTPIRQVCRPSGFCYRPEPTPQYTPTPSACLPPPGCNPAVESCAAVCYPQKVGNA